jgi:hypothetical protein
LPISKTLWPIKICITLLLFAILIPYWLNVLPFLVFKGNWSSSRCNTIIANVTLPYSNGNGRKLLMFHDKNWTKNYFMYIIKRHAHANTILKLNVNFIWLYHQNVFFLNCSIFLMLSSPQELCIFDELHQSENKHSKNITTAGVGIRNVRCFINIL